MNDMENNCQETVLLEEYKLYVTLTDKLMDRRERTHRFYISVHSILIAVLSMFAGGTASKVPGLLIGTPPQKGMLVLGSFLGAVLCGLWWLNVWAYRRLSQARYQVIQDLERLLPYQCFQREWEILGKGKNFKRYPSLTRIESLIPLVLLTIYFVVLVWALVVL